MNENSVAFGNGSLFDSKGGSVAGRDPVARAIRGSSCGLFITLNALAFMPMVAAPEPSTFVLAAIGLAGLAAWGWRRREIATRKIASAAAVLLLVMPCSVYAGTLDAHYAPEPANSLISVHMQQSIAQTFTIEHSGLFDRLELQIAQHGPSLPLIAEIRLTLPSGAPDLSLAGLAASFEFSSSIVPSDFPSFPGTFTGIDLGEQAFHVTAGEQLAIVLTSETSGFSSEVYSWLTTNPVASTYDGGISYMKHIENQNYVAVPEFDFGFNTFVATPEPGTLLISVIGCAMLVAMRLRQRASHHAVGCQPRRAKLSNIVADE